jgi:hypothetical protein
MYELAPDLHVEDATLSEYARAFPEAEIHASPGLAERRPDLELHATLSDQVPPAWREQLDQALTAGNVFFSEAVLLHRDSVLRTVADEIVRAAAGRTRAARGVLRGFASMQ